MDNENHEKLRQMLINVSTVIVTLEGISYELPLQTAQQIAKEVDMSVKELLELK